MGNCHIWNGQVADLVAPIFQKQTFRGNPPDSLCSYLVLASYVVFSLIFPLFFPNTGAMQGWRMAKPRTGKRQDVRTRSSVTTGPAVWFFQLFQLFPITAIFLNLIAACCSIGTSLLSFFLIVLCKGSLHSIWLSDYFPSFYVGLWPLQRDHFWISIPHDSPSAKQLLRQEFHDIVAETPNSQTRCLQQGRSWNPGGLRVERGYWELPW